MYERAGELSQVWRELLSTMPRVVEDQQAAFANQHFFTNLARLHDVRYTSIPHAPEAERRERFLLELRDGRLPITVLESGLNLELHAMPVTTEPEPNAPLSTALLQPDGSQVRVSSRLILNGVCVRWKGYLDRLSLQGQGRLEFDAHTAREEEIRLRAELEVLGALRLDHFPLPPVHQDDDD